MFFEEVVTLATILAAFDVVFGFAAVLEKMRRLTKRNEIEIFGLFTELNDEGGLVDARRAGKVAGRLRVQFAIEFYEQAAAMSGTR